MKLQLIAIATTAALASGIGVASAADNHAMKSPTAVNAMAKAQDVLSLTPAQEHTAWRNLSKHANTQTAPSSFTASIGATMPSDISLRSVPAKVAARVSALKPYDYALLHNKLVIVNPTDKKVVGVITHRV